jgi:hypothetical protein
LYDADVYGDAYNSARIVRLHFSDCKDGKEPTLIQMTASGTTFSI